MSEQKLKPCPFCGGEVTIVNYDLRMGGTKHWIITRGLSKRKKNCDCRVWMESERYTFSDGEREKEALVKAWNRRDYWPSEQERWLEGK